MPRSKRNRPISLTATQKKGRSLKQQLVESIRDAVDSHSDLYIFRYDNMRSSRMKQVRHKLRGSSRFFLGKNKVMQLALGKSVEDEYSSNLRRVSSHLIGQCGIIMTSLKEAEIKALFEEEITPEFANAGFVPKDTIHVDEGPLEGWPVSMIDQFRRLGLSVEVRDSQVNLLKGFDLCTKGKPITPEQAKLLTLFDKKLAIFRLHLTCHWHAGEFEEYEEAKVEEGGGEDAMSDEDL
jgi:mRNA turnover protein 4